MIVLTENEALLLKAKDSIKDGDKEYKAGEVWLKLGPCDYIPHESVEIIERR